LTLVEELADFVVCSSFDQISREAVEQLKIRVLDSLGCALGALGAPPINTLKSLTTELGGSPLCTLIGEGSGDSKTSPDRAAFYNSALVRYLDYNDSFLAKGETCHPSDNVGAVLAAAELSDSSGKDFLVSLAVAYQVQCRLSEVAPVRSKGFDHTTQGAYAVAAGVSRALQLDARKTANAIAISGTALNALRVTRTGKLSNWKGLAYPFVSFGAMEATLLAQHGITGPLEVFEGNKGFMDSISGRFEIDWKKEGEEEGRLDAVLRTILKKYNAEIHSQSAIECLLDLKEKFNLKSEDIETIEVRIFDTAYNIIGGGEEGEKYDVKTKEQADHSLPYILAVALLDGKVTPTQYEEERIARQDVQKLLRKVKVFPDKAFSDSFPREMRCSIKIKLNRQIGGKLEISEEKRDYEGFVTRPMKWEGALAKFDSLSLGVDSQSLVKRIANTVKDLEFVKVRDLTKLLGEVRKRKDATT
jgi:2-methylcitrate dehydratase